MLSNIGAKQKTPTLNIKHTDTVKPVYRVSDKTGFTVSQTDWCNIKL